MAEDTESFTYHYSGKGIYETEMVEIRERYLAITNIKKEEIIMNRNDQEFIVENIRTQYTGKETSELDELKALDSKVRRPANVFAYVFGSISALIMGTGMSFIMTDLPSQLGLGNVMVPGVIIGVIGIAMAAINYPLYQKKLNRRRMEYADQILALSDKILNK